MTRKDSRKIAFGLLAATIPVVVVLAALEPGAGTSTGTATVETQPARVRPAPHRHLRAKTTAPAIRHFTEGTPPFPAAQALHVEAQCKEERLANATESEYDGCVEALEELSGIYQHGGGATASDVQSILAHVDQKNPQDATLYGMNAASEIGAVALDFALRFNHELHEGTARETEVQEERQLQAQAINRAEEEARGRELP